MLALRWQDVDISQSQIYICRSLHHTKSGEIILKGPKTEKSRRAIALSPSTIILLETHKQNQNKLRVALGYNSLDESRYVFCQHDGKLLLPNTITQSWIKLSRKAGLHGVRLHDARHTNAPIMLKQGIYPKIVQERLGHSSIQVTLDTYSHVTLGLQESAAKAFYEIVLSAK